MSTVLMYVNTKLVLSSCKKSLNQWFGKYFHPDQDPHFLCETGPGFSIKIKKIVKLKNFIRTLPLFEGKNYFECVVLLSAVIEISSIKCFNSVWPVLNSNLDRIRIQSIVSCLGPAPDLVKNGPDKNLITNFFKWNVPVIRTVNPNAILVNCGRTCEDLGSLTLWPMMRPRREAARSCL